MLTDLTNEQLQALFSNSPIGMVMLDTRGSITWANETLLKYTNRERSDWVGQSVTSIGEDLRRLFETPDTIFLPDAEGGSGYWLIRNRQALPENQGQLLYYMDVSLLQELALEREELRETVRELKAVDEITGLPNRRALYQKLEPEVSRSRRYDNPLSIILMKLENSEQLFMELGKENTEKLLLQIAQMLNDQLRWADIIGRLDENEFLMVLPETTMEATDQLVEKIQANLAQIQSNNKIEANKLIATFGSAQWHKGDDVAMLMRRARETLDKSRNAA